jgi:hypothetical protein
VSPAGAGSSIIHGVARQPVRSSAPWKGAHLKVLDDPRALLSMAERAIRDLALRAASARVLRELQQIDQLVTRDLFHALCDRGIPLPLVSELVWPAVAALERQASLLAMAWRPALSHGDWDALASEDGPPQG